MSNKNKEHDFNMDEFHFLRSFRKYIGDNNLAKDIFNSNGTDECIINMNDIIRVFKVSNDKIDKFISRFKSFVERYVGHFEKRHLKRSEKTRKSLESIYSEFNGLFDKINEYIENKDFTNSENKKYESESESDSEYEESESDSENEEPESSSKNEETDSDSALNKIESGKNLMKSFSFYKLDDEEPNEKNLCILNKASKKLYNFQPPHDLYGKLDSSGIKLQLDEDKDPEENISNYYEIKVENGIENIFISGTALTFLADEAKEEYFDDERSYLRFKHIPGKLMSCGLKAIMMRAKLERDIALNPVKYLS